MLRSRRGHAGSRAGAGALRPAAAVPGRPRRLAAAAPGGEERLQEAEQGERAPSLPPRSPGCREGGLGGWGGGCGGAEGGVVGREGSHHAAGFCKGANVFAAPAQPPRAMPAVTEQGWGPGGTPRSPPQPWAHGCRLEVGIPPSLSGQEFRFGQIPWAGEARWPPFGRPGARRSLGVIPPLRALSHAVPGRWINPCRLKHREETPWQLWGVSP